MTFDEFKKQFEVWRKIDTPEILKICEHQYQQQLLIQDDNNYFEPLTIDISNDILGLYEENLSKILGVDNLTDKQIYLLIKPSFEPESLLELDTSGEKYSLTYKRLTKNYWASLYSGDKFLKVKIETSKIEIDALFGTKLFNFLDRIISEARAPNAPMIILDGVRFRLYKIKDGEKICVQKAWSENNSKSAEVIELLYFLIDNMNTLDSKIIADIEDKISSIEKFGG